MTDRIHALTVTLDKNYREDDVEVIVQAIRQLRGVLDVTPHVVDGITQHTERLRARTDIEQKLWAVLHPEDKQ